MTIYNPEPRLFLTNKFTNCYFFMIRRAQSQNRQKLSVEDPNFTYYENHHVIPRALGGLDLNTNMVLLTAYEHFVCHWLLVHMCQSTKHKHKMSHALRFMRHKDNIQNIYQIAKLYDLSKQDMATAISAMNKGRKRSKEYQKMMEERMSGSGNIMYGKTHSEDTIKTMSEIKSGENNPNYGKKFSDDHKKRLSDSHANKPRLRPGLSQTYLVTFPDGSTETVTDRFAFCSKHGYRPGSISTAAATGKIYRGLKITYANGQNFA